LNITPDQQIQPLGLPLKAKGMSIDMLGMYLFLASEAMFFVGLLGSFVVLESAGGQHQLFVRSSEMLSKWIGLSSILLLLISSYQLMQIRPMSKSIALIASLVFLLLQLLQWTILLRHHTLVLSDSAGVFVSEGAMAIPLPKPFDIHSFTPGDFGHAEKSTVTQSMILQDLNYGPSRNNFFACYFLMSAVHCLHLVIGIVAVLWFLIFPRPVLRYAQGQDETRVKPNDLPPAVQIYWHFVNAIGLFSLAVLYFV
jgi:heme/copper-type cytochrome/quinol oxidase subunit 3